MRRFLFLLLVLLSGSALDALPTPLLVLGPVKQVPPQCADPTYACQDLENARQCGVVKSCSNDIWATMNAPEDNDDICDLCKKMVKEARDQLLSNMTQEELKEVFEGSCKLLPIKLVADGCIKIVDEFIPELVEMLASRMDPNMVCTVAGLCNLAHLPIEEHMKNLLNLAVVSVNSDRCEQCTTIMTEMKSFVGDMSEADFKKVLVELCEQEAIALVCTDVLGPYASKIYQFIMSSDPKTVCTSIDVCPSTNQIVKVPLQTKNVNDDLVCQFCSNVLEHIKEMIIANTTEEEFRRALLNCCNYTGSFSKECTSLVNDYFDMMYDYIRKLDTKTFCTLIGLCQSGMHSNKISPLVKLFPAETLPKLTKMVRLTPSLPSKTKIYSQPLVKLVPAKEMSKKNFRNIADIETNEIFGSADKFQLPVERLAVPMITIDRDLDCPFCKAVSFFLKKDLGDDRSRDGVRGALSTVCDKWVHEYPEQCRLFLEKYSDHVLNHITENGDFDNLCPHIKACQLQEKDAGVSVRVISPSPAPDGEICDMCKKFFDKVETLVSNPDLQKCVQRFLEQGCQICPSKQKCIDVIDREVNNSFSVLEKNLQSSVACPALHLCPDSEKFIESPKSNDLECELCKEVVQKVEDQLNDKKTKEAVTEALEKVCDFVPSSMHAKCVSFIDTYTETLIALLLQEISPDVICAALKMCPNSGKLIKPPKINDLECDLCKEVVQKIEDQLKDDKTEEAVIKALEKVCDYLPSSMYDKCVSFIDTYTEKLITLLVQEMSPDEICAVLNICPKPPKKIRPPESDMECEVCKQVVMFVENECKDEKTEEAIKKALDRVCSMLPAHLSVRCTHFVDAYSELLINLLLREMDPAMVCGALSVCPTQGLKCESCQLLFHFIQEQLANNESQGELKNLLKRFCDLLPRCYADNCDAFVDEYGAAFFMLIAQELDPSTVCPKLQMCPSTKKHLQKVVQKTSIKALALDDCQLCMTVIDYIDKLLEDDSVDKEITEFVEKVCNIVPASVKDKCSAVVETYGPYILQMIGQVANSKEVCQDIDFCSRPPGHVHLLGEKKCTFGPSYWCKSKAHAAACKAEMYCSQRVWKN